MPQKKLAEIEPIASHPQPSTTGNKGFEWMMPSASHESVDKTWPNSPTNPNDLSAPWLPSATPRASHVNTYVAPRPESHIRQDPMRVDTPKGYKSNVVPNRGTFGPKNLSDVIGPTGDLLSNLFSPNIEDWDTGPANALGKASEGFITMRGIKNAEGKIEKVKPVFRGAKTFRPTLDPAYYRVSDTLGWMTHAAEREDYGDAFSTGVTASKSINEGAKKRPNIRPVVLRNNKTVDLIAAPWDDINQSVGALPPLLRLDAKRHFKHIRDRITRGEGGYKLEQEMADELLRAYERPDVFRKSPWGAIRYSDAGEPSWAFPEEELNKAVTPWGTPINEEVITRRHGSKKPTAFLASSTGEVEDVRPRWQKDEEEKVRKGAFETFLNKPKSGAGAKIETKSVTTKKNSPWQKVLNTPEQYTVQSESAIKALAENPNDKITQEIYGPKSFDEFLASKGDKQESWKQSLLQTPEYYKWLRYETKPGSDAELMKNIQKTYGGPVDPNLSPDDLSELEKFLNESPTIFGKPNPKFGKLGKAPSIITPSKTKPHSFIGGLGGSHDAGLWNIGGKQHVFKPSSFSVGMGEETGSDIAETFNNLTPVAQYFHDHPQIGGQGTLQEYLTNAKHAFEGMHGNEIPQFLSPQEKAHLGKEQVIDWLIGNHDAHKGQFLYDVDKGGIIPIDKGQAFKHWPHEINSPDYHPNKAYGEDFPIYKYLQQSPNAKSTAGESAIDFASELGNIDVDLMAYYKHYANKMKGHSPNFNVNNFLKFQENKLKNLEKSTEHYWFGKK